MKINSVDHKPNFMAATSAEYISFTHSPTHEVISRTALITKNMSHNT